MSPATPRLAVALASTLGVSALACDEGDSNVSAPPPATGAPGEAPDEVPDETPDDPPDETATPPSASPTSNDHDDAAAEAKVKTFTWVSQRISAHPGAQPDDANMIATVMTPPAFRPDEDLPFAYHVHGFGGTHDKGQRRWARATSRVGSQGDEAPPRVVHVFLDANHRMGHHAFADSANTGPWGAALVEEFIPALESEFAGEPVRRDSRFVTGHSSGGWSSLWLQVEYPEFFGGVWSTAPDPVEFRDFTGIDIYSDANTYRDSGGDPRMLVRRRGRWTTSFEEFARREAKEKPVGGQMYSFDAVFSPRGDDGEPRRMFDRETGAIDRAVAESWKPYDIGLKLQREWTQTPGAWDGALRVFVGTEDTFRLEGAARLLRDRLSRLGSDAVFVFAEGRSHFDLYEPESTHWPRGLHQRIEAEMWEVHTAARPRPDGASAVPAD